MRTLVAACLAVAAGTFRGSNVVAAASNFPGLHITKDDAAVTFGVAGDVLLRRKGAGQLQLDGALSVDGEVDLSGDLSFISNDGATVSLADLYDLLRSVSETVEANTEAIGKLEDEVALLFSEVADPSIDRGVYTSEFHDGSDNWVVVGADLQTMTCNGYDMLGGNLGTGDSASVYIDGIPAHSSLEVKFVYVALDNAGTQTAKCYVDDQQVWTDTFTSSTIVFENLCSASSAGDQFEEVTVAAASHYTQGATLKLDSTLTSGNWAVADVSVTSSLSDDLAVVYVSDFTANDAAGWAPIGDDDGAATTACDHGMLILGGPDVVVSGTSLTKDVTDLGVHTELIIAFEFVQFGTWGGENAELFVDSQLVWSQTLTSNDNSASLCSSGMSERVFSATVTTSHWDGTANLRFATTFQTSGVYQVFGIKSINVLSRVAASTLVYESNFATVGSWTFSGATAAVSTCGTYQLLGGYNVLDKTDSVSLFIQGMAPHSSVTITFDFARIDSWDSETAYVYVDDVQVWSRKMQHSDGTTNTCGASWSESFHRLSFTVPHFGQAIKVGVSATLDGTATDESWGIANFKITSALDTECNEVLYVSDFEGDGVSGWTITGALLDDVTTCGDYVLLGGPSNFGVNAAATKVIDMGDSYTGVIVSFTFFKIDSWESETAQLYANDALVWSESLTTGTSTGSQLCGSTSSTWTEEPLHRSVDLGWITTSTLTLKWTSTLDSAASDEAWGLSTVSVYKYAACDAVPYQSNFAQDGAAGYLFVDATAATTTCGSDTLLGGYDVLANTDEVHRLFELPMHTSIQVDFTFVEIDSWDTGEKAYFYIDYDTFWDEAIPTTVNAANVCGSSTTSWLETYHEKSFTTTHFAPFSFLTWSTNLNGGGTDESWGLLAVKVSTFFDESYTPFWISDFSTQSIGDWVVTDKDTTVSGYFSTCNSIVVFGGYGIFAKTTVAQKTLTGLPQHASVTVGFTWAKIDSWDSEYFYVKADAVTVHTSAAYTASSGDAFCGSTTSGWNEAFISDHVTFAHADDKLVLQFTTSLNSAGTDEAWGLVGVAVYLS